MSRHSIAVFGSLLVAALSLVLLPLSLLIAAGPREQEWKQVEQAMAEGKPESALRLLEPIITQAINEKRYPEAIKAVATRARLESLIQGNKPEERIKRLAAEIDKAVPEMKPALEAILANW